MRLPPLRSSNTERTLPHTKSYGGEPRAQNSNLSCCALRASSFSFDQSTHDRLALTSPRVSSTLVNRSVLNRSRTYHFCSSMTVGVRSHEHHGSFLTQTDAVDADGEDRNADRVSSAEITSDLPGITIVPNVWSTIIFYAKRSHWRFRQSVRGSTNTFGCEVGFRCAVVHFRVRMDTPVHQTPCCPVRGKWKRISHRGRHLFSVGDAICPRLAQIHVGEVVITILGSNVVPDAELWLLPLRLEMFQCSPCDDRNIVAPRAGGQKTEEQDC